MKILLIDNYDSFTYNLYQYVGSIKGVEVSVKRNDEVSLQYIKDNLPDKIMISPGPGKPEDSKLSLSVIENFYDKLPILGICLGHQAIALSCGAKVSQSKNPVHGKTAIIKHDEKSIFKKIPQNIEVMRYHSLEVERSSITKDLIITADLEDSTVMGIRHNRYPLEGVQFHPESILTSYGKQMIINWISG